MPEWGARAYFFFECERRAVLWDLDIGALSGSVDAAELLPSRLTAGDFTPVGSYPQRVGSLPTLSR